MYGQPSLDDVVQGLFLAGLFPPFEGDPFQGGFPGWKPFPGSYTGYRKNAYQRRTGWADFVEQSEKALSPRLS